MKARLSMNSPAYYIWSIVVLFLMFGFRVLPPVSPITEVGMGVLGIFLGVVVGWSTVGILWPSVVAILALGFTGYTTPQGALQSAFTNPNVLYVLFLFIFVGFLKHSEIITYISSRIVRLKIAKGRPWVLAFLLIECTYISAAFVDVIAAVLIVWEILYSICNTVNVKGENAFVRFNVAGVILAANCGAVLFQFRFPFVMLAGTFEAISGISVNALIWSIFMFILGQCSILLFLLLAKYALRINVDRFQNIDASAIVEQRKLTVYQKVVLGTLIVYVVCMLWPSFMPAHWGVTQLLSSLTNAGITALACVFLVFWRFQDGLTFNDASKISFNWDVFFLTAAALLLSSALMEDSTGINAFLSTELAPILSHMPALLCGFLLIAAPGILTGFANSIVIGILFLQLAYPCATALDLNYQFLAYAILFVINFAFIAPAGSASAPLFHGRTEWIGSSAHAMRYGILMSVIGIVIACTVGVVVGQLLF